MTDPALLDAFGFEAPEVAPAVAPVTIIRHRTKTEEQIRANVRRDYMQLGARYFKHSYMPFHREVLERCWEGGRWIFMLPTEHGKSTLCNVDFSIFSLMEDPDAAHLLMAVNDTDAKRWLKVLRIQLEQNHELTHDYPWIKKPPAGSRNKPWNTGEITVDGRTDYSNANPSVAASGYLASEVKGRRAKTIGDDLEGKGAVQAIERERLYETINTHVIRNIEDPGMGFKRPLLALAGTPFDPASVYFKLIEENKWNVYRQPYQYPDGKLIWPGKQDKIRGLYESLSHTHFSIAMRLDPTAGDDSVLTAAKLKKLTAAEESQFRDEQGRVLEHYTFAFLDPAAGSKNKRVDYAGMGVVKMRWPVGEMQPTVELYEPQAVTKPIIPQVHEAARLCKKYDCPLVLETNGSQAMNYTTLLTHFYGDSVQVIRHHTSYEKKYDSDAGMSIIPTLVHSGNLHVVGDQAAPGARAFREEVLNLGTGTNDHILAGVWFCYRWMWERHRHRATIAAGETTRKYPRRNPWAQQRQSYGMRRTLNLGAFTTAALKASRAEQQ